MLEAVKLPAGVTDLDTGLLNEIFKFEGRTSFRLLDAKDDDSSCLDYKTAMMRPYLTDVDGNNFTHV